MKAADSKVHPNDHHVPPSGLMSNESGPIRL